jgi:hypothetical protein
MEILDLGDPQRWPDGPRAVVEEIAAEVSTRIDEIEDQTLDPDEYGEPEELGFPACDLPSLDDDYSEQAETRLRAALGGDRLVAAHHASRLLPHEEDWIRAGGLLILTEDLIAEKLRRAAEAHPGLLDAEEAAHLRRSGPVDGVRGGVRAGLLYVAAPFSILLERAGQIRPLMRAWGGEAIGWTDNDAAADIVARFTTISVPSIIEVAVAVDEVPAGKPLWPVAVGSFLGLPRVGTSWALRASLGPGRIIGIVRPGDPRWPEALPTG